MMMNTYKLNSFHRALRQLGFPLLCFEEFRIITTRRNPVIFIALLLSFFYVAYLQLYHGFSVKEIYL